MRRIPCGSVPTAVRQAIASGSSFGEISSDVSLRSALHAEQRGLCAYCEVGLRRPEPGVPHHTRIEHFHPQRGGSAFSSICASQSGASTSGAAPLAWSNLLLCCDGHESARRDFNCDKSKENTDICTDFRNPKTVPTTRAYLVCVNHQGRAVAEETMPPNAQRVVDGVLCLNRKHLIAARLRRVSAIEREARERAGGKTMTPKQRRDFAQVLLGQAEQAGFEHPMVNVMMAKRFDKACV